MNETAIKVVGVSKLRGDRPVLRNVDLTCARGSFTVVLGANGTGKSTLLSILAGLTRPTKGVVERAGNLALAYIGHPTFLYPGLTALENLAFQAKINGLHYTENELLDILKGAGLAAQAYEPAGVFSRGMAQRLNFCRVLMQQPGIMLLDEPFTGMDKDSQTAMRGELRKCCESGACIIMVSHAPELDAPLADAVYTLVKGRLLANGDRRC